MPGAGDKRPAVAVHGKIMESIVDRLPSADNVFVVSARTNKRHHHLTPPRAQHDEAPLALWNGVDFSSGLLISRSCWIPCQSCHPFPLLAARTIHQGDQSDGHLGTKACLLCTQGQMPSRERCSWALPTIVADWQQDPPRPLCGGTALLIAPTERPGCGCGICKGWLRLVERIKPKFWLLEVCRNGRGGVADRGALRRAPGADDHRDWRARCQVYVPARG
jgi:hypothetical protein